MGCGETPLPHWHASSGLWRSVGRAQLLAGGSPGHGARSEALGPSLCAVVRACAPWGQLGRRRHVDASLVHISRPVGKAGCRGTGYEQPGLRASAFKWGVEEKGTAHLASGTRPEVPPPAKLT